MVGDGWACDGGADDLADNLTCIMALIQVGSLMPALTKVPQKNKCLRSHLSFKGTLVALGNIGASIVRIGF